MAVTTLILPGLQSSGPEHWQSYWERRDPSCQRVEQAEWDAPRCADWVSRLDEVVTRTAGDVALVGHSSACAMVVHWAAAASPDTVRRVRGALLVAPSDPEGANFPQGPSGFAPVPMSPLPFRSTVVASENDAYVSLEQAQIYARAWGSDFVNAGTAGHINSASGLGDWPEGRALLERLRQTTCVG